MKKSSRRAGTIFTHAATLWGIGYAPVAPGTFGTLAGLILCLLWKPSSFQLLLVIAAGIPIGVYCSGVAEDALGERDSGKIVIDELVGYFVAILFLPQSAGYLVAAFFLFRFFDIAKPFPVRHLEHIFHRGAGVMADDIGAGIYTNIALQIWKIVS